MLLHSTEPPEPSVWSAYLADVAQQPSMEQMRTLVISHGGGPDVKQRTALNAILKGKKTRVSVVSGSFFVRGIVNALNLFNSGIHAFSPARLDDALLHLSILSSERLLVTREIQSLQGQLSSTTVHMHL